jgi:GT2 family glycosyltransferase
MSKALVISTVILTYNRKDTLHAAIRSALDQMYPDKELIVVNNGSTDGTSEEIREAFPSVRILEPGRNTGVPEGRNIGARNAAGDIVLFMDDDGVLASGEAFAEAAARFEREPELGVLFARPADPDTGESPECVFSFQVDQQQYPRPVYAPQFVGTAIFVRKALMDQIQGFDGSFFREAEEFDFSLRTIDAGWRILFYPSIVLHHRPHPHRASAGTVAYLNLRNYLTTYWKLFPVLPAITATAYTVITRFVSSVKYRTLIPFLKGCVFFPFMLPGILLHRRTRLSRRGFDRFMLLSSFPFESYSEVEGHPPIGFLEFCKRYIANRSERNKHPR